MYTFVVPDIHGRPESLRALLSAAGIINAEGQRYPETEVGGILSEYEVVSIGDLCNGVLQDANGDEQCLLHADRDGWIDLMILGNHEAGYLFDNMGFKGFAALPPVQSLYRSLYFRGKVVPAHRIGNTLLTHAGVVEEFAFVTARAAYRAIMDAFERYNNSLEYTEQFEFPRLDIPKAFLIDGVGERRGGNCPVSGILWADWREQKNFHFSQVVGHTPMPEGPVLTTYRSNGTFTLNVDAGAKGGMEPWGVWLDSDGEIVSYVKADLGYEED